jgi:non-lysosomal glucosylceramidase
MQYPILKTYDQDHLHRIALPLGGIGTGTVSLGGRGDLRDWEIMNRPAKGFTPCVGQRVGPSFVLNAKQTGECPVTRLCEGPLELSEYEGSSGSPVPNHGLPRFRSCSFGTAYPFGEVNLKDPDVPVEVTLNAFNPLVPADADSSGIPVAVLRYRLRNTSQKNVTATLCGSIPNFVGHDGSQQEKCTRRNRFRKTAQAQGIIMDAPDLDATAAQAGSIALTTLSKTGVSYSLDWNHAAGWGAPSHDFWKDLREDGELNNHKVRPRGMPIASLAVKASIPAGKTREITFLITWHFPNRYIWNPSKNCCKAEVVGNYYTTKYKDAFDVVKQTVPSLSALQKKTIQFVDSLCESDLPHVVKESALFNVSTLRTQTCFRTPDGYLYGWEGCGDKSGCCEGSCTHVWNYEQATAFLFGDLSLGMREVEFAHATGKDGCMSFRVHLPLKTKAQEYGAAAADGQMGCVMKIYRDWQLSGDSETLKKLWPKVKKALSFCWIKGGWDADQDGVMEGCQHNTMDVEYYGPNPQMTGWYLGALRAAEEMASHLNDKKFAEKCRSLFASGSEIMDKTLFNGEYYEHHIVPQKEKDIAPGLRLGIGSKQGRIDFQLGKGCLVDQLVGQYMAHVCGLGYLHAKPKVQKTLRSIKKYNQINGMQDHFNCMRSYVLGDEKALLMAAYPGEIPENPFPYFTEVMTGFEYTAAIGMLYEGQTKAGLECIDNIRSRYDGKKRSPFNEAECGHHYARAMASWAAILALTGFHYSAIDKTMTFAAKLGLHFWSTGYAWGTCKITKRGKTLVPQLKVLSGQLPKGTKVMLSS